MARECSSGAIFEGNGKYREALQVYVVENKWFKMMNWVFNMCCPRASFENQLSQIWYWYGSSIITLQTIQRKNWTGHLHCEWMRKSSKKQYRKRHDNVAKKLHCLLCKKYNFECNTKKYKHIPEAVLEMTNVNFYGTSTSIQIKWLNCFRHCLYWQEEEKLFDHRCGKTKSTRRFPQGARKGI